MASGTIRSSLFAATDEARIPDSVVGQIADIFSGDIDFHRALRKGDRFSVVYEALEGDGEPLRTGRVLSRRVRQRRARPWFQADVVPGSPASKGGYYTLDGKSLRRATWPRRWRSRASPAASRCASTRSCTNGTPTSGIDYAGAIGTPVRSVGDGVVEFAGWQNGFGNVVMIRHHNNDDTVYAHLSRIDVRARPERQPGPATSAPSAPPAGPPARICISSSGSMACTRIR